MTTLRTKISNAQVNAFAEYCIKSLHLETIRYDEEYQSLPACILDCIYSLRAKYYNCTVPVVDRYAQKYMNGNRFATNHTLKEFIGNIDLEGGCEKFAKDLLHNLQYSGGVLKSEVCYNLARKLISMNINTLSDFQIYNSTESLEQAVISVKGVGYDSLNYLFMLAGDTDRCKPDVHIHRCVKQAIGCELSDKECQNLFTQAIVILNQYFPKLTIRKLDFTIWNIFQSLKR